MISQQSISDVMARASIVDVVGQFVRLKKRGSNYIANCPFHNEKSPSFNVSPSRGIYKCFGCGKAGNVVTFLQEHEKLTYPESIKWLADYFKIAIEETERSPEQKQHQQEGEALRIVNEYAAGYFHNTLLSSDEGQIIGLSYFKERGFRKEIIERFRLGYNPEQEDAFYRTATAKGHSAPLLEKAGLIKNRNGIFYDAYRGRVIFPIQNLTGRIIGFGARILKKNDKAPKYVNTPENELYVKSKTLYGIFQSRQAIGKADECYLVEGYTDVISLHQGGVENVIASSGTSLTEDQLRLIGQLTKNLTILYDGDSAGVKAALRGLDMALAQSFNVKLVLLPEGEDPDSYIQKAGVTRFNEYVKEHKQDVISFRLQVGLKEAGEDPVKRSRLVNEIAESISRINKAEDFALQGHYIRETASKLGVDESGLVNLVNKHIRDRIDQEQRPQRKEEVIPPATLEVSAEDPIVADNIHSAQEWQLLKILIEYGHMPFEGYSSVAAMLKARIDESLIENTQIRNLYDEYFSHFNHFGSTPEIHFFMNHPDAEVRQKVASLLHHDLEISPKWKEKYGIEKLSNDLLYVIDIDSSLNYFEYKNLLMMQEEITSRLKAEADPELQMRYQMKFMKLREMEREILKKHHTVVFKSLKYHIKIGKDNSA